MIDEHAIQVAQLQSECDQLRAAIASLATLPDLRRPLETQLAEKEQQLAALQASAAPALTAQRDVNIATQQTINNYGSADTPDRAMLLREYLLGLAGMCNRLSLADADSSDPTRAAVELAAVYTRLEVASTVPMSAEDRKRRPGADRQRTALEVLTSQPQLVLLGDPGGGKSTFVNFVSLCLVRATLGEAGWIERLGEGWIALLPIRVVLRELAAWLEQQPQLVRWSGLVPWNAWLIAQYGEPIANVLRVEIAAGRALLLLDGLDEVPAGADGQPLAQVIHLLTMVAAAVPSRMLITCRVLDYQQPNRQLAKWRSETLIPFSDELRHEFIGRWYDVLVQLDRPLNGDAVTLCARLRAEVRDRVELRRLAGNPLLLTMMTLLHAYEGRLPDERVKLYEKCIEFLLLRWRAERGDQPLRVQLDLPQWNESDLGRLLDRLGLAAHSRGVSGDGEAGADLPYAVLIETARAFFAGYDPDRAYSRAETFCRYISRYSNGILQQYGPETYRFPHRTFQEYLAARRLTSDGDWGERETEFVDRALARAATGTQWREALLLATSRLVVLNEQIRPAADLAEALLDEHPEYTPAWARNATLAGEVLNEIGRERLGRLGARRAALWERVTTALVIVLGYLDQSGSPILPVAERIRTGRALAALGDPRFPTTIDQWRAEPFPQSFGNPSGYWCALPAGTYRIGGWDEGEPSADISLPAFWTARFPITVAQFAPFVAQGYAPDAERWWTPQGWEKKWSLSPPQDWDTPNYTGANQPVIGVSWYAAAAFCAWLTEQLAGVLPNGYSVRLPTEAEWETAASYAPDEPRRTYPWGEEPTTPEYAIYDETSDDGSAPVGCCPAGAAACGALDMAGNVLEWGASHFERYPSESQKLVADFEEVARFTPEDGVVPLRGGAWLRDSTALRCGSRDSSNLLIIYSYVGFRIVVVARSHNVKIADSR